MDASRSAKPWFGNVLLANRLSLEIAAGIFVILAALTFVGTPLPGALSGELRLLSVHTGGAGLPAAALLGVAFAVGWTPCVGPTLAAILTLSAGAGRRAVSVASASLLVAFGILLIAGQLVERTARLARYTGRQI